MVRPGPRMALSGTRRELRPSQSTRETGWTIQHCYSMASFTWRSSCSPSPGFWKVLEKAGEKRWAAIVPFYNMWVLVRVACREWWRFILFFIPFVSIVALFVISIDVAKNFGKPGWYGGLGLVFLSFIFYPVLGFGSAEYQADAA